MKKMKLSFLVLALSSAVVMPSYGFDIPGVKKESAASGGQSVDASGLQEGLVKKYVAANVEINTAQTLLAQSLGLKDSAASLEANAKALSSGNLDQKSLSGINQTSENVNQQISAAMAESKPLSDDSKKLYAESLPHFVKGMGISKDLPAELKTFSSSAQQQISAASMIDKLKVKDKLAVGMYLVSDAPKFITNTSSTLKSVLTYAKANKIETPKNATDVL